MVFDFGYRLRETRLSKKLTQTQVADLLHLSKSAISGYENNVKTPSLEVLVQLCLLYDVSADYLVGLERRESLFIDGLTSRQRQLMIDLLAELKTKSPR